MELSEIGKMAEKYWLEIPNHFPFVELDTFLIMPNHVHGIIIIDKLDGDSNVETKYYASLQLPQKIISVSNLKIWHRLPVVLKSVLPNTPRVFNPISPGNPVFAITSSVMKNHITEFQPILSIIP